MSAELRIDPVGRLALDAARAAGIGVIVVDVSARPPKMVLVNEVLAGWLGTTRERLLAGGLFDPIAIEDRARIAESFARRAEDPSLDPSLECTIVAESGERIPVAFGVSRGEVEGHTVQLVFLSDLRDRKVAAAKLSASERRFRDALQAAPDGVVISQQLVIKFANRAADAMLGVAQGALLGRSLAEFLSPDEIERMRDRLGARASGEQIAPAVYRATRPDGSTVLAEIASIETELDGERAVLAVARDVTDREALQANLERTERLAALGRLSAGMAHEINNPLAFVSLSAEALERRLDGLITEPNSRDEIASLLENISRGTARVASIVRDLKAFSRDGDAERGPVDLEQVLSSAIRMVQHEITPRARFSRHTTSLPLVVGSGRKLEQVFVNLLMNAVQALPEGRSGHVTIRESSTDTAALVSISDDGVGIARAHLDRVFDPFFTTKPVGLGTGLGLSICHGIVTACGGTITVDSDEGRGTTVHVTLPRAMRHVPIVPATIARPSAPPTPRGRILVVEDQLPLARTLAKALSDRHDVTLAPTVAEALAAVDAQGETLDVVFCDMLLPDGTGIDVFEHARARRPGLAPRFVFMTGGAFLPSLAEFLERVPNDRIDKPFGLPVLEDLLARVMSRRQQG